jgi:hypothetical protein
MQPENAAKWAQQYIICRDWLKEQDDAHKARCKQVKDDMDKLEGKMLTFLKETGQQTATTPFGTFFKTVKRSASISDVSAFMHHVIGSEDWDLLDKKANVTAVVDFAEHNSGQLPPGVNLTTKEDVNVRRPSEK